VTGSDDRKVKVVVAETGQVIYNTAFHDDWVRTVLYTTQFFISCSDDRQAMLTKFFPYANRRNRTVRIYNASTGTVSGEAWSTGQTEHIRAIAVSPDGKILAAGSNDYSIILYDMETRKMIRKPIRGHNGVRISVVLHTAHILRRLVGDQMSCVFE
jgi:WD40 repeat protein